MCFFPPNAHGLYTACTRQPCFMYLSTISSTYLRYSFWAHSYLPTIQMLCTLSCLVLSACVQETTIVPFLLGSCNRPDDVFLQRPVQFPYANSTSTHREWSLPGLVKFINTTKNVQLGKCAWWQASSYSHMCESIFLLYLVHI